MRNEEANKQRMETRRSTQLKRQVQLCKVFICKIQDNKLNASQSEKLKMMFVEAKWIYNNVLNRSKNGEDIFKISSTEYKSVSHFDKDGNEVISRIDNLSSQPKQSVLDQIKDNIKGLSVKKKNGYKNGTLKFKSEISSLNLKQYGSTYSLVGIDKVKLQGIKKPIKVNGLNQIHNLNKQGLTYELANAKLLNMADGYYIAITVFIDELQTINKIDTIGVDFGCSNAITLSNGIKFDFKIKESKRLKKLQQKIAKTKKGSNNRYKLIKKLKKEYLILNRIKNNEAYKIFNQLKQYKIVMQDEQLSNWQQNNNGRTIASGILGRLKTLLKRDESTIIISKWIPTTKFCSNCGTSNNITLSKRTYKCNCGYSEDRDVHAAKNMIFFNKNINNISSESYNKDAFDKSIKQFYISK